MTRLEQYASKYESVRFERRNGILQMTLHTQGGPYVWNEVAHREFGDVCSDVAGDPDNKVVILTGTGDAFCDKIEPSGMGFSKPSQFEKITWEAKRILENLLAIRAPVIGAVNGPALIHAELVVLSDIVLASDTAEFQDLPHFHKNGVVPGDGVALVWPLLLGMNRGRYFLLTGQKLSAKQALDLGVVSEVLPPDKLLPKAWELAEQFAQKPPMTLLYTREVLTLQLKQMIRDYLPLSFALEGLGVMEPRQRPSG